MSEERTYTALIEDEPVEITLFSKENIGLLIDKVRLGNDKLGKAWSALIQIDHNSEAWQAGMAQWTKAQKKLSIYCEQLKLLGFNDCLYIQEQGGKRVKTKACLEGPLGCLVCPSAHRYWESELMALPSAGKNVKPPESSPPKQGTLLSEELIKDRREEVARERQQMGVKPPESGTTE